MFIEIKKRLAEEINTSGLTISQIADRIGVSREMVSQYKNTNKMPSLENFAKLCIAIGASADYILGINK